MAADPSSFDYYRRGQPLNTEKGRPDNSGFDYYRRGQPLIGLVKTSTVVVKDMLKSGMVIPFNR